MGSKLCLLLLLIYFCSSVLGGYFTIVGPRTVQLGEDYKVFLTSKDYYDEEEMEIKLVGTNLEEVDAEDGSTIQLRHHNKEILFKLSENKVVQNYTLSVEVKTDSFKQSVDIFMLPKRYSIFIQTDKPMYKPSDTVQFRVFAINFEMKPYEINKIKVEVRDSNGEVIRTFDEDEENIFNKGAYVNKFDIIEQPPMGFYDIRVYLLEGDDDDDDDGEDDKRPFTNKTFEVKEYVLPRFELNIETKPELTTGEKIVKLTVFGLYTFGEYVTGTATITANVFDSAFPTIVQHSTSKTVTTDFKKEVQFDMKQDLKMYNAVRPYIIELTTEFEESLSGQKSTKMVPVRIHRTGNFSIFLTRERKRFKPGTTYKLQALVRKPDGSIPTTKFIPLEIKIDFVFAPTLCAIRKNVDNLERRYELSKEYLLKNGAADIKIDVPLNTTALVISAKFEEATTILNVTRHFQKSEQYLSITKILTKTSTASPKIGKKVSFSIESNEDFSGDVFSVIIGRTGIIQQKTHNDSNFPRQFKLDVTITKWMSPACYLVVYFIEPFGEVVYDKIKIDVEAEILNKLDLKLTSEKAKPGQKKFSVSVKTAPNSFVSLLGVDKSVTLLGSGNDIDKPRVQKEMEEYNAHESFANLVIKGTPSVDRYNEFGESNAFLITNADKGTRDCLVDPRLSLGGFAEADIVSEVDEPDVVESDPSDPDKPRIRRHFPETWIFSDFEVDDSGKYVLDSPVPDTITSFIVSGFALHPDQGLAIATTKSVTVVQEFFLNVFLPYSVRLGEVLKVDVTVFNYIAKPKRKINVDVKMFNKENQFEFVDTVAIGSECTIVPSNNQFRTKSIEVDIDSGAKTHFLIRAKETGDIKIKIRASSANHGDEIEKIMLIEHEGLTHSGNKPFMIDLRKKEKESFSFNLPIGSTDENDKGPIIWNSISIDALAVGDLLGPAIANVHSLIRMPSGCTEQQFKSWIPNIAAVRYLKSIGKLTEDYRRTSESYLSTGYQQLLARKQPDGSFSLWGEAGEKSIWLTAYVGKLLAHVKELVAINDKYLVDALNFVKSKQSADGSFPENIHNYYYMKTKAQFGVPLTAFVAIAYLEQDKLYKDKYSDVIEIALTYLNSKVSQLKDNFSMAITAYAFALKNHEATRGILDDLKSKAVENDKEMYWNMQGLTSDPNESPSVKVEIAAYTIMAFVTAKRSLEAVKIMNWLMTQRNAAGGFYSTTDTVVGLQALAMIATEFHTADVNMNIKISYEDRQKAEFKINSSNSGVSQSKELKKNARIISLVANGQGFALFQVAYRYNTVLRDPVRRFDLTTKVLSSGNVLHLQICASFIPEGEQVNSLMTLIEVNLPSGYVYDKQTADMVKAVGVRRTETEKGKTIIILYFDQITTTKICPEIKAIRQTYVTQLKQSVVRIYDYYDKNSRASAFYLPSGDSMCSLKN